MPPGIKNVPFLTEIIEDRIQMMNIKLGRVPVEPFISNMLKSPPTIQFLVQYLTLSILKGLMN